VYIKIKITEWPIVNIEDKNTELDCLNIAMIKNKLDNITMIKNEYLSIGTNLICMHANSTTKCITIEEINDHIKKEVRLLCFVFKNVRKHNPGIINMIILVVILC
jgi:hypothetical protein